MTEADYLRFCKFAMNQLKGNKSSNKLAMVKNIVLWMIIGSVLVTILRTNSIRLSDLHWPTALLVSTFFLLFISIVVYETKRLQKRSIPNANGLMLGDRELEFNDKGISDTTALGVSFYQWEAVALVATHGGDVYIFLDKLLAQIVPASSFHDKADRIAFVAYINKQRGV